MGFSLAYDCISTNLGFTPVAQRAGYATGSADIKWTAVQFANNPGVIVIDQDPGATDHTADVLDVESGAATVAEIPAWVRDALASYAANARPGQRMPLIYVSRSNLDAACKAITDNKFIGVGIWLADPDLTIAQAEALLGTMHNGVTIMGVQFQWDTRYDTDVFESSWLSKQSGVKGDTVQQGSSGPAVKALQVALTAAGHKAAEDGLFGAGTTAMVKAFQTATKLTVDGIAGLKTWAALEAKPPTPTPPPAPKPPTPTPPPAPKPPTPTPPPALPKLAAPNGVKLDPTQYPLTWNPVLLNGKPISQYRVYVTNSAGGVMLNGVVTGNYVTLTNLVAGQKYKVAISAVPPTGYQTTVTTLIIP